MAIYLNDVSRTFGEYLLIPGLTTKECIPSNVSLKTPMVKFNAGEKSAIELNIPFVSAIMQSVSGPELAIELARNGGLSFIFGSQPIASQAEMVRKVKKFKAGFVISDSNLTPDHTLADVLALVRKTEHSTIGVTHDGTPNGKLLGMVTSRDYREGKDALDKKVSEFMTPFSKLIVGEQGITLSEANQIIWDHKLNTLPIIDKEQHLQYFVFRKDYDSHRENPMELSGADFIKVGIGGGSICITREQKGIGRGQATALIDVAKARDAYYKEHGVYIPICSDGGLVHDYHMVLALAMGADFLMMGRYFARFDESPTKKLKIGNNFVKEYWGEGSNRAKNWQRYDMGGTEGMKFEEGVDSYVPYAGKMKDNLKVTLGKMIATMCSCGSVTIQQLQNQAKITLVSSTSIVEGGAHDVILKSNTNV